MSNELAGWQPHPANTPAAPHVQFQQWPAQPTNQLGWYPDPTGRPGVRRYFDGTQWTDQYDEEPRKSMAVAGLLQLFLGWLGIGRFYIGSNGIALAQLLLTVLGVLTSVLIVGLFILPAVWLWGVIDGIVIFAGGAHDKYRRELV